MDIWAGTPGTQADLGEVPPGTGLGTAAQTRVAADFDAAPGIRSLARRFGLVHEIACV